MGEEQFPYPYSQEKNVLGFSSGLPGQPVSLYLFSLQRGIEKK